MPTPVRTKAATARPRCEIIYPICLYNNLPRIGKTNAGTWTKISLAALTFHVGLAGSKQCFGCDRNVKSEVRQV